MPIYEYRCKECQQVFEKWCKQAEEQSVPHNCPICKGAAERLISHTSFALKGQGWYVTEYGSRKEENKKDSKSADESAPAAETSPPAAVASGAEAAPASPASGTAS